MTVADEARSMIFERIRAALGAERLDRARRSAVQRRLERHPRGPIPSRAKRQARSASRSSQACSQSKAPK